MSPRLPPPLNIIVVLVSILGNVQVSYDAVYKQLMPLFLRKHSSPAHIKHHQYYDNMVRQVRGIYY